MIFEDFDFSDFWEESEYANKEYVGKYPTDEIIKSVESELGYKLPTSYVELMRLQNGGIPKNTCYPTKESTSWAKNHIAITGILGIGNEKSNSLCGEFSSKFWVDEWGYPDSGVYFCDCPSAGHDMIMLDYTNCGKEGEPEVVHIDQESDYKKTFLAINFENFIRGLVNEDIYDTSEQNLKDTLDKFKNGNFSDILQEYFKKDKSINFDKILRSLFTELTKEKGYFALHADKLSHLAYDIQFYLLSINRKIKSKEEFSKNYIPMVAIGNNEISTGGYGNFFENWFDIRLKEKDITKSLFGGYMFTEKYKKKLFEIIKTYE